MCKLFPVCLQKNKNKTFLVWLQAAILHGNARMSICHVTVNFTLTLCSACQDLPGQSPTLQYLLQQKSLLVPFCQLIGRKGAVHAGPDHYTVVLLCARHVACIWQWFRLHGVYSLLIQVLKCVTDTPRPPRPPESAAEVDWFTLGLVC